MATRHHTALARATEERQTAVTAKLRAVLAEWGHSIAKKLSRMFAEHMGKALTANEIIVQEMLKSIGIQSMGKDMIDEISDELVKMYASATKAGFAQVKFTPTSEIVRHMDVRARAYADARGAELVGMKINAAGKWVTNPNAKWSINTTTRNDLQSLVTEAIEKGWSPQHLRDEIMNSTAFSEERASMIARTELAFAHMAGNVAAWRESGGVWGKRSLLGDLHDIPDECDDNADQGPIPFDQQFDSGDEFPPYHPNCVCDVVPVLHSEMAEV